MRLLPTVSLFCLLLTASCGGEVGTCTCTCNCTTENCIATGIGRNEVSDLTGDYTEDECDEAGQSGGNLCGGFDDGSTICTSSWEALTADF